MEEKWAERFKEVLDRKNHENPIMGDEYGEFNEMSEDIEVRELRLGEARAAAEKLHNGQT